MFFFPKERLGNLNSARARLMRVIWDLRYVRQLTNTCHTSSCLPRAIINYSCCAWWAAVSTASICQLLNLLEIPDRRHINLSQNYGSPGVPLQLFTLSTTLRDDRSYSHAYMQPRYEHAHFLPQYWSGQNRTSRTACAGPEVYTDASVMHEHTHITCLGRRRITL